MHNHFDIIKLIGTGSQGHVYMVKDKDCNTYAMKMIKKDCHCKIYRASTEQEILTTINHPFIPTIYHCFQTELNLYFIMDYCAGGDLYNVLRKQQYFTNTQVKYYAACIMVALEYLHFNGIIHRDVKPENILINDTGHIMLADFGLSCKSANHNVHTMIKPYSHCDGICTEPSLRCREQVGTPEYMAPEVVEGNYYTSAVDWWSFGILLYEMTFGKYLFEVIVSIIHLH